MTRASLLPPLRVRFTEPDDVAKYGDQWFTYDERAIVRKPASDLIEIERETGLAMPEGMNEMRRSSVLGDLFGAWLAVREHDSKLAGSWDDFSPVIMLAEWGPMPEGEVAPGKEDGGTSRPTPQTTSTVILHTLPVVE